MTAFDYAAARDTADRLITKFGQAVSIRRISNTGGTDWEPTQTTTDYASRGAVTNVTRWYSAFADGQDILRTDRLGYVAAGPLGAIVPTPFDLLVIADGTVYRIIDVKPIMPSGVPVLFTLQLRI